MAVFVVVEGSCINNSKINFNLQYPNNPLQEDGEANFNTLYKSAKKNFTCDLFIGFGQLKGQVLKWAKSKKKN